MERPAKRIRVTEPKSWSFFGTRPRVIESSLQSEKQIQGQNTNKQYAVPTRTLSLSDFQRRAIMKEEVAGIRPPLRRRNAGIYLLPRAPDATVTANVVAINVDDGTSTSIATQVPVATDATVVSLSELGSLTVPGITTASGTASTTISDITQTGTTSSTQTKSITDASTITSGDGSTSTSLSDATNGTSTDTGIGRTVTVTSTSTLDISYINGTIITSQSSTTRSGHHSSESNEISATAAQSAGIIAPSESSTPTSTNVYGGAGALPSSGASATSPGSSATSTSSSGSGSGTGNSGPGLTPQQQQVVGGVVGGVAGIAILLLVLLVFLRWYRRRLKERGELPHQIAQRNLTSEQGSSLRAMSQMSSGIPLASALANSLRKFRPHSTMTIATSTTDDTTMAVPESERGFQRLAGRKIAPALGTGGDGYGGSYGAFEKDTTATPATPLTKHEAGLSTTSFYRDNDGFYGGKGVSSPTYPPSPSTAYSAAARSAHGGHGHVPTPSSTRDFAAVRPEQQRNPSQLSLSSPSKPEGMAVLRPSPARTPLTLSPAASSIKLPIQQPPTMGDDTPPLPGRTFLAAMAARDGVGRSLASQDGSRISGISRSSGRSGGRFVENLN